MAIGTLGSPQTPDLHNLPDLVLDKILSFLPTKAAVQVSFPSKQWQGVVTSFPTLNFNEHDDFERHLGAYFHRQRQHLKFINFLEGYLDFRNKYCQKEPLDKLSLHMRLYWYPEDDNIITKWLRYACQIGLKELDIYPDFEAQFDGASVTEHLVKSECPPEYLLYNDFYRLSLIAIASAKSLTSLKLGCVKVPELQRVGVVQPPPLFLSLKILSLKAVRVDTDQALYSVLRECPSIAYLSLAYCSIGNSKCYLCCSSLKYLEVKFCGVDDIRVDQAFNLESFSFVSKRYSKCENMILNSAFNLKCINVSVHYIGEFSLLGCHRALEASIKSKRIRRFEFYDGYLSAKLSFKDQSHETIIDEATILVGELWDQERLSSDSTYVPRLVSFIKSFSRCKEVSLYNKKVQALTVFKNYRKMTSLPPLPVTSTLLVGMPNPPVVGSRDFIELEDSLRWIAPSAKLLIMPVDVEEDRKKGNASRKNLRIENFIGKELRMSSHLIILYHPDVSKEEGVSENGRSVVEESDLEEEGLAVQEAARSGAEHWLLF
ncbi:hypothetical protein ACLB2K_036333 [Fragaria x ananassa]